MQCPQCRRTMLEGPVFSRTTHFYCLWCATEHYVPHYTLDGFLVLEPAEYWAGEEGLRWMKRWISPTAHEFYTEREWLAWMLAQGYRRIRQ